MNSKPAKNPFKLDALLGKTLILLAFLLAASLAVHKIYSLDIWWHLKTGQYIINNLSVPSIDIYSYTVPFNSWIDLHWLFQAIIYLVYLASGLNGTILFQAAVILFAFFLLYRFQLKKTGALLSGVLLLLVALTANERFLIRPEIFTFLLLLGYLKILEDFKNNAGNKLWLIPFLQIIWVNIQGIFILGPVILFCYLAGEFAAWKIRWPLKEKENDIIAGKRYGELALVTVFSCLACLINPYFLEGALFPFKLFTRIGDAENVFSWAIAEFKPTLSGYGHLPHAVFFYCIFLGVMLLSIALNWRRLKYSHLAVIICFTYLSLLARRNLALFSFAVSGFTALNLLQFFTKNGFIEKIKANNSVKALKTVFILILIAFSSCMIFRVVSSRHYVSDRRAKRFGLGVTESMFPEKALEFIERNRVPGRMFNNTDIGGYIIWRAWPERKVFVDGRLEVYNRDFYKQYVNVLTHPKLADKLAAHYGINYFLVRYTSSGLRALTLYLYHNPNWRLIYFDDVTVIFIKNIPQNEKLIEKHKINFEKIKERLQAKLSRMKTNTGLSVKLFPPQTAKYVNLSYLFSLFARNDLSLLAASIAEKINPFSSALKLQVGNALLRENRIDKAIALLEESLEIDTSNKNAHLSLGEAFLRINETDDAIEHFKQSAKKDNLRAQSYSNLGTAYAQKGRFDQAERYLEKALAIGPEIPSANLNLADLYTRDGRINEAIPLYFKAIRLFSSIPGAESSKNIAIKKTIDAYSAILENQAENSRVLSDVGVLYAQLGNFEKAEEHLRKAISVNPENTDLKYNLALLYEKNQKPEKALEMYEEILLVRPNHAIAKERIETIKRSITNEQTKEPAL